MVNRRAAFGLLCCFLLAGPSRGSDSFFQDLSKQLAQQGLPATAPINDDTNIAGTAFEFVHLTGSATEDEITLTGLPFKKGWRVQSQTAPDQAWQHFLQRPIDSRWATGDTGLMVFSVHASSDGPTALEASFKGSGEPYPILANLRLSPTRTWTTYYLPFTASEDVSKATLGFFFGSTRQTLELGGVAIFNFQKNITLDSLKAVVEKLPTDLKSDEKGFADTDTPRFPFLTPWDDAKANFVDVSKLNDGPAGSHGFIAIKDGHFVESDTGRRVRFFGTNLGFEALFPSHEDAEKFAAHLAKYGVNAVRFGPDTTLDFAKAEGWLWDQKYPDHRHLDAGQLDKLDYLTAQLEKHGIYIDLILHCTRKLTPADGFPDSVSKIPFPFDKRVDEYDPQMIAIDKEFFRDLVGHVNPYTGKSYATDPGVLDVEINNENSLLALCGETPGDYLTDMPDFEGKDYLLVLPEPYAKELADLWNAWLVKKYGTTEKLAAAWASPDKTRGPNLYPPSDGLAAWTLESDAGTAASLTSDDGGVRVDVTKVDGIDWHVQLYQKESGLLKSGMTYTLTMEMRSNKDCIREVGAHPNNSYLVAPGLDQVAKAAPVPAPVARSTLPALGALGLTGIAQLTPHWDTYTFRFTARDIRDAYDRLPDLVLGAETGSTWIRHVTLKEGDGGHSLSPGQTLEAGTVRVESLGQLGQPAYPDWISFLADTEAAYVTSTRSYLRHDLGVKPFIYCSQIGFGHLWAYYRGTTDDYVDHHTYWNIHDYVMDPIDNLPMVRSLGNGDTLTTVAMERIAGQPTSVTEYNICFPNEYRAEALPEYASFAAFQDWDAIFLLAYDDYGSNPARVGLNDQIRGSYDTSVDPAMWGFMPSAALMFRRGLVPVAPSVQTLGLPSQFPAVRLADWKYVSFPRKAWQEAGASSLAPFMHRIQLGIGLPDALPDSADPPRVLDVKTDDPQTARYLVDAPAAKAVCGFVGGQTISFTGATIAFGHLTNEFGAATLVPLDGKPLAQSSLSLLTLVTHTQNKGQKWNATRTALTTLGTGPPQVDEASANVSIATDGPRAVFTLDGSGEKQENVPSTYKGGQISFAITPEQKSIWYAITKP